MTETQTATRPSARRERAEQAIPVQGERFIRAPELAARLSISMASFWRMKAAGAILRPHRIGAASRVSLRWLASEVDAWLAAGAPDAAAWDRLKKTSGRAG